MGYINNNRGGQFQSFADLQTQVNSSIVPNLKNQFDSNPDVYLSSYGNQAPQQAGSIADASGGLATNLFYQPDKTGGVKYYTQNKEYNPYTNAGVSQYVEYVDPIEKAAADKVITDAADAQKVIDDKAAADKAAAEALQVVTPEDNLAKAKAAGYVAKPGDTPETLTAFLDQKTLEDKNFAEGFDPKAAADTEAEIASNKAIIKAAVDYGYPATGDHSIAALTAFVDGKRAEEKSVADAKVISDKATADDAAYAPLKSLADAAWAKIIAIDGADQYGLRDTAMALSRKFDDGTGTQADLDALNQTITDIEAKNLQQGTTSSIDTAGNEFQTNTTDALTEAKKGVVPITPSLTGYSVDAAPTATDYDIPGTDDVAETLGDANTVNYDPAVSGVDVTGNVSTVDPTAINAYKTSTAQAAQLVATDAKYKATAGVAVAGDATKGLLNQNQIDRVNVNSDQLVQARMNSLLDSNGKNIQDARNRAMRTANSRGMLNSAMAAGMGEEAAIAAASDIAKQDAQTYADAETADSLAGNKLNEINSGVYTKQAEIDSQISSANSNNITSVNVGNANNAVKLDEGNADRSTNVSISDARSTDAANQLASQQQQEAKLANAGATNTAWINTLSSETQLAIENAGSALKAGIFNAGEQNDFLKTDKATVDSFKRLGIEAVIDKNKNVAGWNFNGALEKFKTDADSSKTNFLVDADYKKLFNTQNFELGKAFLTSALNQYGKTADAKMQVALDAMTNEYAVQAADNSFDHDMAKAYYTENSAVNAKIADQRFQRENIGITAASTLFRDMLANNQKIAELSDVTGDAKANMIANVYSQTVDAVMVLSSVTELDLSGLVVDDSGRYTQTAKPGMLSTAQAK
jgi:hypothetical protein